ncbi:GNAT family N-acetyltransferase [Leptospira idonii]|uniref:GNAT family N-acetyltransferase n=1 Tax=Leptospira idonii TaxID=1193500 RepID=A0A4R9M3F5_9LEPT|nr:GNAT family N-acetyltransferase [Leptospira idonii]TGN19328.1 GNAT family N-acetyltransferase [Leptospira idonii]
MSENFTILSPDLSRLSETALIFDEYRQFYKKTSDLKSAEGFLRNRLENGDSKIFLLMQGNQVAGFMQLYYGFSSLSMLPALVLNDLFVRENFRKQGAGELLVQTAVQFGKERGVAYLSLETAPDNLKAQKLYEKLGWEKDTEFFHYSISPK